MNQDNKTLIILAYFSAFLGVCGHASSEFSCAAAGLSVLKKGTAQSSPTRVELNKVLKAT